MMTRDNRNKEIAMSKHCYQINRVSRSSVFGFCDVKMTCVVTKNHEILFSEQKYRKILMLVKIYEM